MHVYFQVYNFSRNRFKLKEWTKINPYPAFSLVHNRFERERKGKIDKHIVYLNHTVWELKVERTGINYTVIVYTGLRLTHT